MQIMPVSILQYIVKSPFLVIRALKFMLSRNSVRDIERHSSYQTAWGDDCQEGEHFQSLSPAGSFFKPQLCHRASGILEAVSESSYKSECQEKNLPRTERLKNPNGQPPRMRSSGDGRTLSPETLKLLVVSNVWRRNLLLSSRRST